MGAPRDLAARNLAGHADNRGCEAEEFPPPPYRTEQVARRWGVPEQAITSALRAGVLKGFKLQKIWLIPRENVHAFERGEIAAA
jgi:hypothetical protein